MEQMTLFDREIPQPLAARLRPETLEEYVGQTHLLGPGKVLRRLIESDRISSMIFWGPPGVGKTTLARIIAHRTKSNFIDFSAVTSGIKEIQSRHAAGGEQPPVREPAPSCLWTRSIASTKRSRTPFFPLWRRAASF